MKMQFNNLLRICLVIGACAMSSSAWAKDSIAAAVGAPFTPVTPIIAVNGNPYSAGTYAVGTIQLFYQVTAYQFTAGSFATFQLNLDDLHVDNTGQTPTYPVTLNLTQTGSTNVVLTPAASSYSVTGTSPQWVDSTAVTISIPASVPIDPNLNLDGTDLVGNLQLVTSPQGSHLDTVTTVQVHIRLVHPTACLRVFNYVTDQSLTAFTPPVVVNLFKNGPKAGYTKNTSPSQLSDDLLVVNTCPSAISFDLGITVDPNFQRSPNPHGNSVFLFTKTSTATPPDLVGFGTGTPQGSNPCLPNLTLSAGDTLLATVHMSIGDVLGTNLPATNNFSFSGSVFVAGTGCPGTLNTLATPNPVSLLLPFVVSQ